MPWRCMCAGCAGRGVYPNLAVMSELAEKLHVAGDENRKKQREAYCRRNFGEAVCEVCKKPFRKKSPRQYVCGHGCAKKRQSKLYHAKWLKRRSKTSCVEALPEQCGGARMSGHPGI